MDSSLKGVTAFLEKEGNESMKLVFHDVEATSPTAHPDWKHMVNFTSNVYDKKKLQNLELTKEQYAQIGENIVIRLLALEGLIK